MSINSKLEHNEISSVPELQKDTDKLEAMFNLFNTTQHQASRSLSLSPIYSNNNKITNLSSGILSIELGGEKFKGIACCSNCLKRAAILLRDLATIVEDIVTEVEKHKVS